MEGKGRPACRQAGRQAGGENSVEGPQVASGARSKSREVLEVLFIKQKNTCEMKCTQGKHTELNAR